MNQPKKVKFAIYLYFVAIVLSFIGGVPNYLAAEPRPPLFGVVIVWFALYGALIGLGYAIALGKNWARHLNAAISISSIAIVLFAGSSPQLITSFSQLIMAFNCVASIAVIVLLYSSSSNAWFKAANA
jgi:xanthine/uracil permease